jgi:hypothetical protein
MVAEIGAGFTGKVIGHHDRDYCEAACKSKGRAG